MAAKSSGKNRSGPSKDSSTVIFGYDPARSWLTNADGGGKRRGRILVLGLDAKPADKDDWSQLPVWLKERAERRRGEVTFAAMDDGPLWLLMPLKRPPSGHHAGQLDLSPYGAFRDLAGLCAGAQIDYALDELEVRFCGTSEEEALGTLVGLDLGAYRYRPVRTGKGDGSSLPKLKLVNVEEALVERAAVLSSSINLARHLVNVPACDLNPSTFTIAVQSLFKGSASMKVDVITGDRLTKEGMGLLAAVGAGAVEGPAIVHMRYRPKAGSSASKGATSGPIAFVGKGVTFDSGGLDLKDAASMRLMKKDMGGAGSVLGLAHWVHSTNLAVPCDFYLALAENAVDERSFRPGDVLTSRAGTTVEIDNTDAEGRLVLADAFDLAVKQVGKDQPALLVDLATLTGAMRVSLGVRLAGMFATDDRVAANLLKAAQKRADPAWRLPLVSEYLVQLKSTVADIANASPGRFGGAITAALFLQRFVGEVPWAHFDMYGWTDPNVGGCTEVGGNGQCVQLLASYLESVQASNL